MSDRPEPVQSLESLEQSAVEGDGRAVRELCERLETPDFRLCLRMLAQPQDAEDAAQDVLIKVVTNLSSFRGDSALSTWVYRIAARHTLGGFVLGLTPRSAGLRRVVPVAAQTAYPGDFERSKRVPLYLLFHVVMPTLTRVLGYFPASRLGLGEDLPAGVALDWAARSATPDIVPSIPASQNHFGALVADVLSWRVADDPFATRAAIERLERLFVRASFTDRTLLPSDAGRALGHLGLLPRRATRRLARHQRILAGRVLSVLPRARARFPLAIRVND